MRFIPKALFDIITWVGGLKFLSCILFPARPFSLFSRERKCLNDGLILFQKRYLNDTG